jgi:hypothetical protein
MARGATLGAVSSPVIRVGCVRWTATSIQEEWSPRRVVFGLPGRTEPGLQANWRFSFRPASCCDISDRSSLIPRLPPHGGGEGSVVAMATSPDRNRATATFRRWTNKSPRLREVVCQQQVADFSGNFRPKRVHTCFPKGRYARNMIFVVGLRDKRLASKTAALARAHLSVDWICGLETTSFPPSRCSTSKRFIKLNGA